MTGTAEDSTTDERAELEEAGEEIEESEAELRTDGGQTVAANTPTQNESTGPPTPTTPSINDTPVADSTIPGQQSAETPDATRQVGVAAHSNHVALKPFQELCGRLEGISRTDTEIALSLSSGTLRFPLESTEAAICERELAGKIGAWVSVLRTQDPQTPLVVNCSEIPD